MVMDNLVKASTGHKSTITMLRFATHSMTQTIIATLELTSKDLIFRFWLTVDKEFAARLSGQGVT